MKPPTRQASRDVREKLIASLILTNSFPLLYLGCVGFDCTTD